MLYEGNRKIDEGYLLSPVDMCLGTEIDKVLASGADCLKIEGRMKSPEYVAAVCRAYRAAVDSGKNISDSELFAACHGSRNGDLWSHAFR